MNMILGNKGGYDMGTFAPQIFAAVASAVVGSKMQERAQIKAARVAEAKRPGVAPVESNRNDAMNKELQRRKKLQQGFASTIKTGGLGELGNPNIEKPTLTGTNGTVGGKKLLGQ
jgi:hypothetical protein